MTVAQLNSRAVIAVGGPDWRTFLQGLLTQDIETLKPGEARFAALLTPQGRLLYDLFVVGTDEGCLLDVAAEHRDAILQRLTLYRLRAKVDLAASDLKVFAEFPAASGVRDPRLPELGARLYGDATANADETAPESIYDAHRLALGAPGPADWGSDKTYPIEANFDLLGGIDFKKGCFVGQETTSRMKRRGQVKSRMLPIAFEGPPPPFGTEILAGDLRAGEVLSGIDGRAMALVRLDRALGASLTAAGRPVRVETPAWFPQSAGDNAA